VGCAEHTVQSGCTIFIAPPGFHGCGSLLFRFLQLIFFIFYYFLTQMKEDSLQEGEAGPHQSEFQGTAGFCN
jgi:hypothetical protein